MSAFNLYDEESPHEVLLQVYEDEEEKGYLAVVAEPPYTLIDKADVRALIAYLQRWVNSASV